MVLMIAVLKAKRKDPQKADVMELGKTDSLMDPSTDARTVSLMAYSMVFVTWSETVIPTSTVPQRANSKEAELQTVGSMARKKA